MAKTVVHATTAVGTDAGTGEIHKAEWNAAHTVTGYDDLTRTARTSNTILAGADAGKFYDFTSGTFTQTFTAAATLTAGWWIYLRNSGTGVVTLDPNASETIDGLTSFPMYPGETRRIICDGSNFSSMVVNPFVVTWIASDTFTKPPGYQEFGLVIGDGGGGGGGGRRGALGTAKGGGAGGGGGVITPPRILRASDLSATETVTIGAAGTAGAVAAGDTSNGGNGGNGGLTTFGAYGTGAGTGGVGGGGGGTGASIGGSGGGVGTDSTGPAAFEGGRGSNAAVVAGIYGGGSGGFGSAATPNAGAASLYAGAGGGAGGSETAGNVLNAPGAGARMGSQTPGNGVAAGTSHASSPVAGNPGVRIGDSGSGGGSAQSAAATAGGAGAPSGGGGGGGSSRNGLASGIGGLGGTGFVTLWGI